jgi:hypothetical protein
MMTVGADLAGMNALFMNLRRELRVWKLLTRFLDQKLRLLF